LSVFFFQAEDGIRDFHVTGVQTCALPISGSQEPQRGAGFDPARAVDGAVDADIVAVVAHQRAQDVRVVVESVLRDDGEAAAAARSEERRVGKEGRCRWWPYQ